MNDTEAIYTSTLVYIYTTRSVEIEKEGPCALSY
jgi:hypothetical protein